MHYNESLADSQELSEEERIQLDAKYEELFDVFDNMKNESLSSKELAALAMQVEGIEYDLQRIWKFEIDPKKHRYWYRVPQCTCPKIDNMDLFGTDMRIFAADCPVHNLLLINSNQGSIRH